MITEITSYKTEDGKIFKRYDEAVYHEHMTREVNAVLDSLEGYLETSYTDGEGYILISKDIVDLAQKAVIDMLKKMYPADNFNYYSGIAIHSEYIGSIVKVLFCINRKEIIIDGKIFYKKYGQKYYANYPDEAKDKVLGVIS